MTKKKTHYEFVCEMKIVNPNIRIVSEYDGCRKKVECECQICGNKWNSSPSHLLNGHGCPECAKEVLKKKNTWSHERFIQELKLKNPKVIIHGTYKKMKEPIKCECSECHYTWSAKPMYLMLGRSCPECGRKRSIEKRRLSQSELEKRLKAINPDIVIEGKYQSNKQHIKTRCLVCGYVWSPQPGNLLAGYGCPNCNHGSTSYPEQFILNVFKSLLGENEVISRDTSAIGYELDIYLPTLKLAIEYGSWHWHCDRLDKDREKVEICKLKDINLITIIDNCPEDYTDNMFWCYTQKIERSDTIMHSLIQRLLDVCDLSHCYNSIVFEEIEIIARNSSRKKTTETFIDQVAKVNPNIKILGDYHSSNTPIKAKCLVCGCIWYPRPGNLLAGYGCPACAGHKKLSQDEFIYRLKELHPNLTTSDKYVNNRTELSFHCTVCSTNFKDSPTNLWHGGGCPVCKDKKIKEQQSEKRIEKLKNRKPNVSVLSKCYGANDTILCSCKTCGYEWTDTYNRLMEKHNDCPKCARTNEYYKNHFADEVSLLFQHIKVLDHYVNNRSLLRVRCEICGYEWSAYPMRLLAGHGCPYCDGSKKLVAQIDGDNVIAIYDSLTEAAKAMNVSKTAILNCLTGKTKTSCGYRWRYIEKGDNNYRK